MNQEYTQIGCIKVPRYIEYGLLIMDGWKSVATFNGKPLSLTEEEYNAFYLLAKRKGEPLTFEQLCKLRWVPEDGADMRNVARLGMDNIIKQVGSVGKGLMRVEYTPMGGYAFIMADAAETCESRKYRAHRRWRVAAIAFSACLLLALLLIPSLILTTIQLYDEPVPLANFPLPDSNAVPYNGEPVDTTWGPGYMIPLYDDVTTSADTAVTEMLLLNPEGNLYNLIFEIALADTGETLYQSGLVEPGMCIDNLMLNRPLGKGECRAILNIYAYEPDDCAEIRGSSTEFNFCAV